MLNKIPLLVIILVIVFLITSLISFISVEKAITSEKIEVKKSDSLGIKTDTPPKTESAMVVIDIVNPNQ